jgi:hypothetical protein
VSLVLIGTTQSCKQEPNLQRKCSITNDEGTINDNDRKFNSKKGNGNSRSDSINNRNELHIAELKMEMQKTKKTVDSTAILKIEVLEAKNEAIKTKLSTYASQESKLEHFQIRT